MFHTVLTPVSSPTWRAGRMPVGIRAYKVRIPWACLYRTEDLLYPVWWTIYLQLVPPDPLLIPHHQLCVLGAWTVQTLSKSFLPDFQLSQTKGHLGDRPERRKSHLKLPPLQPSQVAVYLEEGHDSCQVAFSIPFDSVNCSLLLSFTHKGKNIQLIIALDTIFLVVSIQPTHTFVNESYIQFYPNHPVWVCHLFLSGTTFCKRTPNKYANMGIH